MYSGGTKKSRHREEPCKYVDTLITALMKIDNITEEQAIRSAVTCIVHLLKHGDLSARNVMHNEEILRELTIKLSKL